MVRADWTGEARAFIAEATKDLPETATLTDRRRALNRVAHSFHCTTSHGKKVWSREVRRYLEQHGLEPLHPAPPSAQHIRIGQPDIVFPYRSAP